MSQFQYRNNSILNTSLLPICLQLTYGHLADFSQFNNALLSQGLYFYTKHTAFETISKHLNEEEELYISDLPQFQLSPASACESSLQLVREKQPNSENWDKFSRRVKKKQPRCLISAGKSMKKPSLKHFIFRIDCSLTSSTSVTLSFGYSAYQRREWCRHPSRCAITRGETRLC